MSMRLAAVLICVALGYGAVARAQPLPPDALLQAGTINMAADFAAAPNQFIKVDGTRDGLNVDLCGRLADVMALKVEWTNLAFPGLVPGLQGRRFDALCTAIFINPQRLQVMNMVPYVQWGEGLMVAKASTLGGGCAFKSSDDKSYEGCFDTLSGKTVSVASSGTTNAHLTEQSKRIAASGKPAITVRGFDTNADAIQAIVSGQADAAYLNDPQAAFFIAQSNDAYRMAFRGYLPNQLALATLKPNTALADAFVRGLEIMKSDGSYQRILDKWGVASVPSFAYQK